MQEPRHCLLALATSGGLGGLADLGKLVLELAHAYAQQHVHHVGDAQR